MSDIKAAPETLYLIPGEKLNGEVDLLWCDDPAPSADHDPAEATKYVRDDTYLALESKLSEVREALQRICMKFDPDDADGIEAAKRAHEVLKASALPEVERVPDWLQAEGDLAQHEAYSNVDDMSPAERDIAEKWVASVERIASKFPRGARSSINGGHDASAR